MKQLEQEFVQKMKQFQKLHWIHTKTTSNMRLCYAETNEFYWKGEIVLNERIELTQQIDDKVQYFRNDKTQLQDGSILEIFKYRNQTFALKHKCYNLKINESNFGIHKKFDDRIVIEQMILGRLEKENTLLTVIFHLTTQGNTGLVKFLRESIINYSSILTAELYEKKSLRCEFRLTEDEQDVNKYVCNYNDTCEYQPQEQDAKYINDHYRITQLDSEDQETYYQLFQRVSEYKLSSNTIIRWLIARGFDIDASYTAIMNWVEWRRQFKINQLSANSFSEFSILKIVGESQCGRQIVYTKQSQLHPEKINLERYKWYFIGFLEDVCRSCKGYVDSYITILDVDGFGFSNFDLQMTKSLLNMVLQYFPERQNKVFIINMSGFVMGFYKMLKPFLPTRTNDKVLIGNMQLIFLGKNKEEINQTLLDHLGTVINFD